MDKLTEQKALNIARYKAKFPNASYKEIAEKFNVTSSQVFNAIHKYPDISKIDKRIFTDENLLKEIALYKALYPRKSVRELAKKFKVADYVARYAIRKYSEYALENKMFNNNKKTRQITAKIIAEEIDQLEVLKKQLNQCLAEVDNNSNLALSSRIELLYKIMRIRVHIQQIELESHLKKTDAQIIANIIRRFNPELSNDDIIKIYNEELYKWTALKKQAEEGL